MGFLDNTGLTQSLNKLKIWINSQLQKKANKSGDTFTGDIFVNALTQLQNRGVKISSATTGSFAELADKYLKFFANSSSDKSYVASIGYEGIKTYGKDIEASAYGTSNSAKLHSNGNITGTGTITGGKVVTSKGSNLDDVNDNLTNLAYGENGAKNIFQISKAEWENGAFTSTGGVNGWAGYKRDMHFTEVEPNTTYTASNSADADFSNGVLFYDSNFTFISWNGWVGHNQSFTTPSNARFIRFTVETSNIPTWIQIEKGEEVTEHKDYAKSNKQLTNIVDNISDAYNPTKEYHANDILISGNQLYKVKSGISTVTGVQPPNDTYYEPTTVGTEVSALKNSLKDLFITISVGFNYTISPHDNSIFREHMNIPSGYKYFAPCEMTDANSTNGVLLSDYKENNGDFVVVINNTSDAQKSGTYYAYIRCIKAF